MRNIVDLEIEQLRFFGGNYGVRYFKTRHSKLAELKESIAQYGIREPILVRPDDNGKYEIISGETRVKAAKELGMKTVPAIVEELTDIEAVALYGETNRYREDLTRLEKAYMTKYDYENREKVGIGSSLPKTTLDINDRQVRDLIKITELHPLLQNEYNKCKLSIEDAAKISRNLDIKMQEEIGIVLAGTDKVLNKQIISKLIALQKSEEQYGEHYDINQIEKIITEEQKPKQERKVNIPVRRGVISKVPSEYNTISKKGEYIERLILKAEIDGY